MIDFKTWVSTAGIALTMVGVWMVYYNSPINYTVIDGGGADSPPWDEVERAAALRNLMLRVGVYIVLTGSFAQLVSNFISPG